MIMKYLKYIWLLVFYLFVTGLIWTGITIVRPEKFLQATFMDYVLAASVIPALCALGAAMAGLVFIFTKVWNRLGGNL